MWRLTSFLFGILFAVSAQPVAADAERPELPECALLDLSCQALRRALIERLDEMDRIEREVESAADDIFNQLNQAIEESGARSEPTENDKKIAVLRERAEIFQESNNYACALNAWIDMVPFQDNPGFYLLPDRGYNVWAGALASSANRASATMGAGALRAKLEEIVALAEELQPDVIEAPLLFRVLLGEICLELDDTGCANTQADYLQFALSQERWSLVSAGPPESWERNLLERAIDLSMMLEAGELGEWRRCAEGGTC